MKPFITLFAPPKKPSAKGLPSYVFSILAHTAGFAWLLLGLSHTPQFQKRPDPGRFSLRILETPENVSQPPPAAASSASAQAASDAVARALAAADSPAPRAAASPQTPQPVHQLQTLVQPDAPPDAVLEKKMPLPTVFLWTADSTPTVKPIIQAPPQKPVVAQLRPSIETPNREVNVADIRLASTNVTPTLKSPAASTTAPLAVNAPDVVKQQMPETVLKPSTETTPVRMLSLSDFQQQGPVAIPLANATSPPSTSNSFAGRATNSPDTKISDSQTNKPGAGSGHGSGSSPSAVDELNKVASNGGKDLQAGLNSNKGAGTNSQATANSGKGAAGIGSNSSVAASTGPPQQAMTGIANLGPVTHITLSKDGQFGVVVVGSSLADQYPEIVDVWGGRMVYSVYLHVGGGKNWILQYSVPGATGGAGSGRPDAPWPFDIVRPHFDPDDFNSDALLVHGFINAAGHFDHLALVFPAEFAKVKFLLNALQQWEFRPARQNGQSAAVEVLLIIPEQTE